VRFVGFNRRVPLAEDLQKKAEAERVPPEQFQAFMGEIASDPMRAPLLSQVVRIENNPLEMKMDITIEHVPDVANVQQEQFEALTSLAPAVVFPPQVYIKASTLRNKAEILEIVQAAQNNPAKQEYDAATAKLTLEKLAAEVEKLKADALRARVDADLADRQLGMVQDPRVVPPGAGPGEPLSQNSSVPSPAQTPGF
jgi:hypothetical protein